MFISGNPKLEWLEDTTAKLLEDVVYKTEADTFVVPAGYVTDGASVPRSLSWLYPKYGAYLKAAIVHDWLITDLLEKQHAIESNEVDKTFREAMRSLGIPWARRWIMWAGVRAAAPMKRSRRKGFIKTLPGVLLTLILSLPVILPPALMVQTMLTVLWFGSLFVPNRAKVDSQKT
jgi:uncharacterized protein DUF1353